MKRNRVFRLLAPLTAVVLCMTAFSVTAFAGGGDGDYYTGEPATGSMATPCWWMTITATSSLSP